MNIQSANERARKSLKRNHPFLRSKSRGENCLTLSLHFVNYERKNPEIQVILILILMIPLLHYSFKVGNKCQGIS